MSSRTVTKVLAGQNDLLLGEGQETQTRGTGTYPIEKVRIIYPANSITERDALDTTQYTKCIVFDGTDYIVYQYITGVWTPIPTPASLVSYINTTSGLTATNAQAAFDELKVLVDLSTSGVIDIDISAPTPSLKILASGGTEFLYPAEIKNMLHLNNGFGQLGTGVITYINDTGRFVITPQSGSAANGANISINGSTNLDSVTPGGIDFTPSIGSQVTTLLSTGVWSFSTDIYSLGNVGVRKVASAIALDVLGTADANVAFRFLDSASSVLVQGGVSNSTYSGTGNGLNCALRTAQDSGNLRSINTAGTINASGADYAEYFYKAATTDIVAKGDICAFDVSGKITDKWSGAVTFCVKSTKPNLVGGDNWSESLGFRPQLEDYETEEALAISISEWEAALEAERVKVDRIAIAGLVPVNLEFTPVVGDYIIPVEGVGDAISAIAKSKSDLTLVEYITSVGYIHSFVELKPQLMVGKA